jgi:hypothetical protein
VAHTSPPKGEEGKSSPVTRPAPEAAPAGVGFPPRDADYPSLCFACHRLVMLSPADAVLAEARAVIGDLTVVFCGDCIRQATARMVDEAAPD